MALQQKFIYGSARLYHGAENEGPTPPHPRDRPSAYEKATADLASVAGLLQRRRGRRPPFAFLWRRPGEILPSGDAKYGPATDIGPPRLPTEAPLAGPFEVGIKTSRQWILRRGERRQMAAVIRVVMLGLRIRVYSSKS